MFIELAIAQPKLMRRSGVKGVITGREKEVLKMLVSGLSNKEISNVRHRGAYRAYSQSRYFWVWFRAPPKGTTPMKNSRQRSLHGFKQIMRRGNQESRGNVMSHSEARNHFEKARMNTADAVTIEMLDGLKDLSHANRWRQAACVHVPARLLLLAVMA